jgi:hypothetical protein
MSSLTLERSIGVSNECSQFPERKLLNSKITSLVVEPSLTTQPISEETLAYPIIV